MKPSAVFAFIVLGFFLFAIFGCTGQPPHGGELGASPGPSENQSNPPAAEPQEQSHGLRTAELESVITISRNVEVGPEENENPGPRVTSELLSWYWSRDSSLQVRGKLKEIELGENERYYFLSKYELVNASVTWNVHNGYSEAWRRLDNSLCDYTWLMNSSGSEQLEKLNVSLAFSPLEPVESPFLGKLVLQISSNGSYSLDGGVYINIDMYQAHVCEGVTDYNDSYVGTEEFHFPAFGEQPEGNRIAGSGVFYNYGCKFKDGECLEPLSATGFLVESELVSEMPEAEPTWRSEWELNMPG
ncbi:MAG: hypothetical protein NT157_04090 [Candidatus Micrarchaeota archaeon]|nr:hypothetical protein [Candidatus Micrarchaeota archaeon]